MKRALRFIVVLVCLLGLTLVSQSAMTGACGFTSHELDCPE